MEHFAGEGRCKSSGCTVIGCRIWPGVTASAPKWCCRGLATEGPGFFCTGPEAFLQSYPPSTKPSPGCHILCLLCSNLSHTAIKRQAPSDLLSSATNLSVLSSSIQSPQVRTHTQKTGTDIREDTESKWQQKMKTVISTIGVIHRGSPVWPKEILLINRKLIFFPQQPSTQPRFWEPTRDSASISFPPPWFSGCLASHPEALQNSVCPPVLWEALMVS